MKVLNSVSKFINNPDINELIRYFQYGRVHIDSTLFDIRKRHFIDINRPVIFLSTGRCGTTWFTELLKQDKQLKVFHVPEPELAAQGAYAYELLSGNENLSLNENRLLTEVFLAGREHLIYLTHVTGHRFIETDPRLTYFAPIIAETLPNSIFVHLYRHPAEVVRSGMRRNWYQSNASHELSRIKPHKNHRDFENWENFSQLEKISWLWNETNSFIENFKSQIPADRLFNFNFNEKDFSSVKNLTEFVRADIPAKKINQSLSQKINVQAQGSFPRYNEWQENDKLALKNICGDLALKYGYTL